MEHKGDYEREKLLIQSAQQGDKCALEALVLSKMPLIRGIVKRFHVYGIWRDELLQAGCVGLLTAIRRYDTTHQNTLSSYALPWILGEMRTAIEHMAKEADCIASLDCTVMTDSNSLSLEERIGSEFFDLDHMALHFALEQLPTQVQRLLYLRFFRDKTQKETATLLGMSQSHVSKLEQRAMDVLRTKLT